MITLKTKYDKYGKYKDELKKLDDDIEKFNKKLNENKKILNDINNKNLKNIYKEYK